MQTNGNGVAGEIEPDKRDYSIVAIAAPRTSSHNLVCGVYSPVVRLRQTGQDDREAMVNSVHDDGPALL